MTSDLAKAFTDSVTATAAATFAAYSIPAVRALTPVNHPPTKETHPPMSTSTPDLAPGDVVSLTNTAWPATTAVTGQLWRDDKGNLRVASIIVRFADGHLIGHWGGVNGDTVYRVLARARRGAYVNAGDRRPHPGDVVRNAASDRDPRTWARAEYDFGKPWTTPSGGSVAREELPGRLELLIDGDTGKPWVRP